jgi:glycosyltransferase involved in cell wall biosynthesis
MRILGVTNLYPNPYQPGRATFNRRQFSALAARHEVAIISPILWTDELAARWAGAPRLPAGRRVTCDGITVDHPIYYYTPKVLRSRYGHFFRRSIREPFERAVAEFRPDIVMSTWAYPDGWAAVDLGQRAGLPVAVKVQGCDILNGGFGLDRQPGRKPKTIEAVLRADLVIAVSRHLADRVVDLGADPSRVQVVYNAIDVEAFRPGDRRESRERLGLDPGVPIVLFVGNLVRVKGAEVLVEACARMARSGQSFECHLIGQGPLRPRLEKQIADAGLSRCVHLRGSVPNDRLPDWYRSATVVTLPSYSEGLSNVLLEAVACGTPFVASRVGGNPEVARLGPGRLVPPGDPGSLARALAETLSDGEPSPRPGRLFHRTPADEATELTALFEVAIGRRERSVGSRRSP